LIFLPASLLSYIFLFFSFSSREPCRPDWYSIRRNTNTHEGEERKIASGALGERLAKPFLFDKMG